MRKLESTVVFTALMRSSSSTPTGPGELVLKHGQPTQIEACIKGSCSDGCGDAGSGLACRGLTMLHLVFVLRLKRQSGCVVCVCVKVARCRNFEAHESDQRRVWIVMYKGAGID